MSLGFNKTESEKAVLSAQNSGAESIENIIAYAIKNIK
jgi:Holliday junction resolvasome RuvABC DNA-binding subunit